MIASKHLAILALIVASVVAGPVAHRDEDWNDKKSDESSTPSTSADMDVHAQCEKVDNAWTCIWTEADAPTPTANDDSGAPSETLTWAEPTSTASNDNDDDNEDEPTATKDSEPTETSAPCEGNCYSESKNWVGDAWLADGEDDWEFFDRRDPTHGRVEYVNKDRAAEANLTYATEDTFIMRADYTTTLKKSGPGRESVRINTKKHYSTFVSILDIRHMPEGAATWPAYWTVGNSWPSNGELDIIEGVNMDTNNLMSLHTDQGCTQPDNGRKMTGDTGYFDCDANGANGNQGCGVRSTKDNSFGSNFNANGGGWYAVERTESYIKVWFWPRDSDVPTDVRDNTGSTGPDSWGTPTALFVSDSCDLGKKFGPNQYVINLTFCGDWAGNTYDGGKTKCEQHVNKNPVAFENAYWDIARMTLYQK